MKTPAPRCSGAVNQDVEGRGDRARPAQGGRGAGQDGGPPACATPTSTSSPATWCPPEALASSWACPIRSRSSAATRAPGVVVEVGPGRHERPAGRPRLGQLHPVVRALPLLLDRPPEPLRPRRRRVHAGPDHRRHHPPLRRRAGAATSWPSSAPSASTPSWPRRRSSRSTPTCRWRAWPSCRAAWPPGSARRWSGPGRRPATRSSSSASAASASTPCRAPRWPGPSRVIAVDPVEFKREKAMELGATHTVRRRWRRPSRSSSS